MKIRTSISIGIIFLLIEFMSIGILCLYSVHKINHNRELMIQENYKTLQYTENMNQALDELQGLQISLFFSPMFKPEQTSININIKKFEENLSKEEKNITEYGEAELVKSLRVRFNKYKSLPFQEMPDRLKTTESYFFLHVLPLYNEQKTILTSISNLNMHAIIQKNENLNTYVNTLYKNLSIVLAICFMVSVTFLYNFPYLVLKPVKDLTERISEIAQNNYAGRIDISKTRDLKELSEIFNHLLGKLEEKYKPVFIKKEIQKATLTHDNQLILVNISSLLSAIDKILHEISNQENHVILSEQAENLKVVEENLRKLVKK